MKFYSKYFANNYEELITYYPRFYRDVFEMVEILKAHGGIIDELEDNIEQTYLNTFIDYADEATIEQLEKFLMIGLNKSRTLEERRRLVKSYFVGFGKVSASMLAEMIQSYTRASVEILFEPFDDEGNNMLYIRFQRGDEPTLYMSDINLLLSKKIPAHIAYQAAVTYRFPAGVGIRRKHYRYGYELCGTKPEIAMIGALHSRATAVGAQAAGGAIHYWQAAEEGTLTGTTPEVSSLAALVGVESIFGAKAENYTITHKNPSDEAQEAGRWPSDTMIGRQEGIDARAEVKASDYGVDYIYCGTRYSQS